MDRPLPKSLRDLKPIGPAKVARSVGITPAQLARLEANQRGLYFEHFASMAAALDGNARHLAPNLDKIVLRREDVTTPKQLPEQKQLAKPPRKSAPKTAVR